MSTTTEVEVVEPDPQQEEPVRDTREDFHALASRPPMELETPTPEVLQPEGHKAIPTDIPKSPKEGKGGPVPFAPTNSEEDYVNVTRVGT